jgi:hypothetical protein
MFFVYFDQKHFLTADLFDDSGFWSLCPPARWWHILNSHTHMHLSFRFVCMKILDMLQCFDGGLPPFKSGVWSICKIDIYVCRVSKAVLDNCQHTFLSICNRYFCQFPKEIFVNLQNRCLSIFKSYVRQVAKSMSVKFQKRCLSICNNDFCRCVTTMFVDV